MATRFLSEHQYYHFHHVVYRGLEDWQIALIDTVDAYCRAKASGHVTIAEIARVTGLSYRRVKDTVYMLAARGWYFRVNRARGGRVVSVVFMHGLDLSERED